MRSRFYLIFAAVLIAQTLIFHNAEARDLKGRLGVGYNSEFANTSEVNGVPAISAKYGFSSSMHGSLILGMSTASPANSVVAAKVFQNIFNEVNLNFYGVLGVGLLAANSKSAVEVLGGVGTEIFIPGLESVGLSFEAGASLSNISGSFVLKTLGASFLEAGVHFYF